MTNLPTGHPQWVTLAVDALRAWNVDLDAAQAASLLRSWKYREQLTDDQVDAVVASVTGLPTNDTTTADRPHPDRRVRELTDALRALGCTGPAHAEDILHTAGTALNVRERAAVLDQLDPAVTR